MEFKTTRASAIENLDNFIKNTCTCHAEIACLRNMFYTYGTNTYGKNSIPIKVV